MSGEEPAGPGQEPRAGVASLISQDLGIGQPGVVIDGGVDIVVADPVATVAGGAAVLDGVAAMRAVAAASDGRTAPATVRREGLTNGPIDH